MKHLFTFLVFLAFAWTSQAQAPRYSLMEHFTNTRCGICGSQNPAFRVKLDAFTGNYHHMSIHPSTPYSNCVLYQANTIENQFRADLYNVSGTPRVAINGANTVGLSSVSAASLETLRDLTSPIAVNVTETTGTNRTVDVTIETVGTVPAGDYKIFVALVEKTVDYSAPNGEIVHHNVFRKFASDKAGDAITLGGTQTISFSYSIDATWDADKMYALAFVQNATTREVLNSGTRFDANPSSTQVAPEFIGYVAVQNPVNTTLQLKWNGEMRNLEIYDMQGRLQTQMALSSDMQSIQVPVASWSDGLYIAKITTTKGQQASLRVLKQ